MSKLKLNRNLWTSAEVEFIKENYKVLSNTQMATKLGRSTFATCQKMVLLRRDGIITLRDTNPRNSQAKRVALKTEEELKVYDLQGKKFVILNDKLF